MDYENKDMELVEMNDAEATELCEEYSDDSACMETSDEGLAGKVIAGVVVGLAAVGGVLIYKNRDKIAAKIEEHKQKKLKKQAENLKKNGWLVHKPEVVVDLDCERVSEEPIEEETEE